MKFVENLKGEMGDWIGGLLKVRTSIYDSEFFNDLRVD
jgi:hypothetical protein